MLDKVQKGLRYLKKRGVREFAARAAEKYADAHFDYDAWIRSDSLSPLQKGYQKGLKMENMPRIWVMLLREKADRHRESHDRAATVASIRKQTYGDVEISDVLTTQTKGDDLVVFIREGDLLPEQAFFELVYASQKGAGCLYTDQDSYERGADNRIHFKDPVFKPGYDPDYLRSMNYIGRLFAVRADLLREARDMSGREDFATASNLSDPASYYEMVLLSTDLAKGRVVRIPKVLCHIRPEGQYGSARPEEGRRLAAEGGEKMRLVLKKDLDRRGRSGIVEYGPVRNTFHVRYLAENDPLVSIVIPNKDHKDLLCRCLDSIYARSTWEKFEVVIVENNSRKEETFAFYRTLEERGYYRSLPARVVRYGKEGFHFSELVDLGVKEARGEYVVLMNNDVTVKTADWTERLLGQCSRKEVGAAGPKLLYPDGTVQSAGIVTGLMGFAGSMMVGEAGDDPGYMARASVTSDMSAVTAACMMVRKSVYEEAGGFSKELAVALNDVDFCLKLGKAGLRVVFDPTAVLIHHESKSRGYEDTKEKRKRFEQEKKIFRARWGDVLKEGDPFYNPNLSDRKCDYSQKKMV